MTCEGRLCHIVKVRNKRTTTYCIVNQLLKDENQILTMQYDPFSYTNEIHLKRRKSVVTHKI